jgi:outer membrane protein OmpA-like peptidoglycan-associated protein
MNNITTKVSCLARYFYPKNIMRLSLSLLAFTGLQNTSYAQDSTRTQYSQPSWWFGVAGGANFNFYNGSTQRLNDNFKPPVAFRGGDKVGVGLFLAPHIEYRNPESLWGFMLQVGYDSRKSAFREQISPCNCPADLTTKLSYISVEPTVRFNPSLNSGFYIYGGPRFAYNIEKSFAYQLKANPDYPGQVVSAEVKGDLSNVNQTLISMQIGMGYDIPVSSPYNQSQYVLTPFISYQPYFGQSPRSIETWTVSTLRAGAIFKFGRGQEVAATEAIVIVAPILLNEDSAKAAEDSTNATKAVAGVAAFGSAVSGRTAFSVNAPKNIPAERRVRETFPLRNYVFFDLGSTSIPDRYVLLTKNQVKDFKEDQLEVFTPKKLSGRSKRQMTVYYNILNILGDRMQKNPSSTVTLVGSSELGESDARQMSQSIKTYLVVIFGIDPSRINVEGRSKPKIPSEKAGGTDELVLLREGDRRVSIESSSPEMLMEFQSGPDAPLKPVVIGDVQDAPVESYVTLNAKGSKNEFTSWNAEVTDESGKVKVFGPYTKETVSIPGKAILGDRPSGRYKVTMVGKTKSGKTVTKDTTVQMVLWKPSANEEGMRYSVLFEFNESNANSIYEKYLNEIVIPKIQDNSTVIIHGHTDVIGNDEYNQQLSYARANEVKGIIEAGLAKRGKKGVQIDIHGFGEDTDVTPFENRYPEERFYNRTVLIDIVPAK